jgi:hypothetical protein
VAFHSLNSITDAAAYGSASSFHVASGFGRPEAPSSRKLACATHEYERPTAQPSKQRLFSGSPIHHLNKIKGWLNEFRAIDRLTD